VEALILVDSDEILALQQGDRAAFQRLVGTYSEKIYRLALSILQHQEDAEDVTQDVFTTVYSSIAQFKQDAKLSTWMYRITVNKCQELIRRKSRKKRFGFMTSLDQLESTKTSDFMHPGVELENKERAAILFKAINRLPENQRLAFTMHKLEGIPYDEIAQILNVTLASIESLLYRAKQQLKQSLSDYYEENER